MYILLGLTDKELKIHKSLFLPDVETSSDANVACKSKQSFVSTQSHMSKN